MLVEKVEEFDLIHTFECGQCFRWEIQSDGSFTGVVGESVANISMNGSDLIVNTNNNDEAFWNRYLDLDRDYSVIKNRLAKNRIMKAAISTGSGIHILKQPEWECLVSFIISQNNNIPRIKKIINALCENYGARIDFEGKSYYSFPSAEKIVDADLSPIKSGFRAKYIQDAAYKVLCGDVKLDIIWDMSSLEAETYLKQIKGVGDKVADCVLLFAYQKFDVFPKDVWIKRIVTNLFGVEEKDIANFARDTFKDDCGFAQQYLFYQARE